MPINPANKLGDPNYRWYNCNLEAPRIKCRELNAQSINNFGSQDVTSGVFTYSGSKPMSTTHVFTATDIPLIGKSAFNSEISFYFANSSNDVGNITMAGANKNATSGVVCTIYQRIGTMTSVDASSNGATGFTITVNPAAECRWVCRGF
jgi:hypothetical protein